MSTPNPTLPTGTLASDLAWNDEDKLHLRVTFHEARLGLPARQTEYVDAANYYLRALAASHTRAEAETRLRAVAKVPELASDLAVEEARDVAWEAAHADRSNPPVSATAKPTSPVIPLTGYDRLTRAFAAGQPAHTAASAAPLPTPAAPTPKGPTGVSRITACYARQAKTSPTN